MALERTPLEPAALAEAARKVLAGPPPLKLMAARGLAPLPRPADLAAVLYQLALDPDAAVCAAAQKTAGELPEKVIGGALADAGLDPRVIDFFAARVPTRGALIEAILLNRATADETVRELAGKLEERALDLLAGNEERLLRAPGIIAAMYLNPRARMSTVDRAVELAARNGVVVPGIPSWDEVVASVLGTRPTGAATAGSAAETDAAFAAVATFAIGEAPAEPTAPAAGAEAAAAGGDAPAPPPEKLTAIDKLSVLGKIRLATLGNSFARSILIRDTNKQVALAAIRSPAVTDLEAVRYSANRALSDEVVRVIANNRDWTKLYQVKVNLVNNPKCPLPAAMRLLPFLHDKELRSLAKSKGISSALASQAKKLVAQKMGR